VHIQGESSELLISRELSDKIIARSHLLKNISMKIFKAKMEKDYGVQLTTKQLRELIVNNAAT
jgi:hypothetical protein